ncbi:MAG: hypothetical protein JST28_09955 [Acidobacteria bacterium]|nr:hypothetical protein [Acidobacteriota bacterium]
MTSTRNEKKSLKDRYRLQLWIIVAVNTLFLYGIVQTNAIRVSGLRAMFNDAQNLVPVGVALIVATVLNGLVNADTKARLVFLRWHHALPGHRAFTEYALRDPRIDVAALEKIHGLPLPTDPTEQNRTWYRMYKSIEDDRAVSQAHLDYLFMRDYAGLCAVFLIFYGVAGALSIPSMNVRLVYVAILIVQFVLVRQAACNYGIRFVTTVLARADQKEAKPQGRR